MPTRSATPPTTSAAEAKDTAAAAAAPSEGLLPETADGDGTAALSAQAYLEKTVMGVLALGLEDMCRVRPSNPVDYLGTYLLRRSTANNTVEVTYEDTLPKTTSVEEEDEA